MQPIHLKVQRPRWLLQRVSGESRGFGSLDFALAVGEMEVWLPEKPWFDWDSDISIWTDGEEISGTDTRSLGQVWWKGCGPFWILGMS